MSTRTAWMLLAIGLGFVAVSGLMLGFGAPDDRAIGLACLVFFGACALVGAFQLLPKRTLAPDAQGVVTLMPDPMQQIGLIIGAGAMSAGCYFIAPLAAADGNGFVSVMSWIGVAFFGLGAPVGLWRLLRAKPQARLDSEGVQAFGPMGWSLAWRDVTEIGVCDISSQRFVAFEAPAHGAASLSDRANDALGLPRHLLGVTGTAARFEDLHALALSYWTRYRG
jgi:hypothetical protein